MCGTLTRAAPTCVLSLLLSRTVRMAGAVKNTPRYGAGPPTVDW
jgi:hypothetical protein